MLTIEEIMMTEKFKHYAREEIARLKEIQKGHRRAANEIGRQIRAIENVITEKTVTKPKKPGTKKVNKGKTAFFVNMLKEQSKPVPYSDVWAAMKEEFPDLSEKGFANTLYYARRHDMADRDEQMRWYAVAP